MARPPVRPGREALAGILPIQPHGRLTFMLQTQIRTAEGDPLDWPKRFAAAHGRAPRVLHLCNVANYAYVNARLMRRAGVTADVFDPDFYHIMASPEWLEADVEGDYGQDFYPNWRAVNLHGYRRPDWFVQAPLHIGLHYFAARNQGRNVKVAALRKAIDYHRLALGADPDRKSHILFRVQHGTDEWSKRIKSIARRLLEHRPKAAANGAIPAFARDEAIVDAMPAELHYIKSMAPLLESAFSSYDVIQGYTTGGLYPASIGFARYVAYELGTLRGLPFEDSTMGRICAWTYKSAPEVMITNIDCFDAADRLGLDPAHTTGMLHAFDLDAAIDFTRSFESRRKPGDLPYFLAPARHHWKEGNLSWLKGNDVLIRGAGLARRRGHDFRIVFVSWGQEIELSKELIREEGLEDRVEWVRPQCRRRFWPIYADAVGILDQFRAPAMGGVSLESMALGKRLISALDTEACKRFFSAPPPMMIAHTVEEVAGRIAQTLEDREDSAGVGSSGQNWMRAEHSIDRQLRDQFTVYERMLAT